MRLALIQTGVPAPSTTENVERAMDRVAQAHRDHGPDVVVLPEFFNTSYFAQSPNTGDYWHLAETIDGPSVSALRNGAREYGVTIVAGIYERGGRGQHFDTAVLIGPEGTLMGRYRKVHAPAIAGGYEKLYYTPGDRYPVFQLPGGWKVGMMVCYDWRFPEAARSLALAGADLIVVPFATPRMDMWQEGLRTRAWENQVFLAACNRAGLDGAWNFSGESLVAGPDGGVLALGSPHEEDIVVADCSLDAIDVARGADFNWRDRRPDTYGRIVLPNEETLI